MKILASEPVAAWLTAWPPLTKQRVRRALRGLAMGKGDIKALSSELEGFCRLRVGGMRIIYTQLPGQILRLEYSDTRDVVYEAFTRILENRET